MNELIAAHYSFQDDTITGYDANEHTKIRALLLGHRIEKITDDHLKLDDGTIVKIVANQGCGGCSSGWYELSNLNDCDNIITAVEFDIDEKSTGDSEWETETVYSVFVVAEDKRINLFAVSGDDGNGYYGTGYELLVRMPNG